MTNSDLIGFRHCQPVAEATCFDSGSRMVRVTVIRAGWSANGVYYPQEVLPRIAEFLNGPAKKCYLNHTDNPRTARKLEDWVADVVNAYVDGDAVKADIKVHRSGPHGSWLVDRMQSSDTVFGPSIVGVAETVDGEREGRTGKIVKRINHIASFDIVSSPAAGGRIERVLESHTFPITSTPDTDSTDAAPVMSNEAAEAILLQEKATPEERERTRQLLETGKPPLTGREMAERKRITEKLSGRRSRPWWDDQSPDVNYDPEGTAKTLGLR